MPRGNRRQSRAEPMPGDEGDAGGRDSQYVAALGRGLTLLGCFRSGDEHGLGNRELARRSGLAQPTVSRLAYTLMQAGYLSYDRRTARYQLGPSILTLSYVMLGNMNVGRIARPFMRRFVTETDVTVAMNVHSRFRMVVIEGIGGNSPVALRLDVGTRIPVATTAAGRAYLAGLTDEEREPLMAELERLTPPADWPRICDGIARAAEEIEKLGFCLAIGEWRAAVSAAAVPLAPVGAPPMSLSCGGSVQELPRERVLAEIGPQLVAIRHEIEQAIAR